MADNSHTITVHNEGSHYEATVKGLDAKVKGTTLDEALTEAERALVAHMIDEAKKKRKPRGKGRIA